MAEVERLRAENERLLNWITGDSDALSCLQAIYQSPETSEHARIKAATSAIGFERAKPATTTLVLDFRERVRQARLKSTARLIEQVKTIEHDPEPPALPEPA
jgi:hypothetical protein